MFLLKQITTEEASNGFEALQLLAQGRHYDVILMDYHMPYMDGLETVEKIRNTFAFTTTRHPIVLLHSSADDDRIIRACDTLGIQNRLLKPIKLDELYQVLKLLNRKEETVAFNSGSPSRLLFTRPVTVLIVDDNKVNQLLTRAIIDKILPTARIVEGANGLEAVRLFTDEKPDLIIMDIQMPELNGYEATQRIRSLETDGHIPIIALTAGNVKGERETCLAAGMDDFVTKPVVEASFRLLFDKWLIPMTAEPGNPNPARGDNDHFDGQLIRTMAGNDQVLMSQFVKVAEDELLRSIANLQQQLKAGQLDELKAVGHKLAGTALSAGMANLARLAQGIEQAQLLDINLLQESIVLIQAEVELIIPMVRQFRNR